jgi:hypothetical protein
VVELGAEFLQGGIGLLADELAHQCQGSGVAARLAPPGMGPRRNVPGRAPSSQQLLEERATDPEQGGHRTLGATLVVVGVEDFLS